MAYASSSQIFSKTKAIACAQKQKLLSVEFSSWTRRKQSQVLCQHFCIAIHAMVSLILGPLYSWMLKANEC